MTTASVRPMYIPPSPARAWPPIIRIALSRPSSATVLRVFFVVILLGGGGGSSLLDLSLFHELQRAGGWVYVRHYRVSGDEFSAQELHRQRILNQALDGAPHRPCPVGRVVAFS